MAEKCYWLKSLYFLIFFELVVVMIRPRSLSFAWMSLRETNRACRGFAAPEPHPAVGARCPVCSRAVPYCLLRDGRPGPYLCPAAASPNPPVCARGAEPGFNIP